MKKVILTILDGVGLREETRGNAVALANKPTIDYLLNTYPNSKLDASEEPVGLPKGQMGNSEVGHMNIGAGRIVPQGLLRINESISDKSFFSNVTILEAINYCKTNNKDLHLCGILSDGAVHGHVNHLLAILDLCKEQNFKNVYIHVFLDGRDTEPLVAPKYVSILENKLLEIGFGKIATIQGRYYAMNRDRNWELTKMGYDAMVNGVGVNYAINTEDAFKLEYKENLTDEFMKPTVITENNKPVATIKENDVVFMYNFREDRMIQLLHAFNDKDFKDFERKYICTKYLTMTAYEEHNVFDNVSIVFDNTFNVVNDLAAVLNNSGFSQLRVTEFEKSAHVTFFFDCGKNVKYDKEDIIIFERPKVFTYDMQPEMRSREITDKLLEAIKENKYDFILVNYPNGDAVGHSGVLEAAITAIEAIDKCLAEVYEAVKDTEYTLIVAADHGNCEYMIDENGDPDKKHTTNPVPFIICDKNISVRNGKLGDIAPTILKFMGKEVPLEMTGNALID